MPAATPWSYSDTDIFSSEDGLVVEDELVGELLVDELLVDEPPQEDVVTADVFPDELPWEDGAGAAGVLAQEDELVPAARQTMADPARKITAANIKAVFLRCILA